MRENKWNNNCIPSDLKMWNCDNLEYKDWYCTCSTYKCVSGKRIGEGREQEREGICIGNANVILFVMPIKHTK